MRYYVTVAAVLVCIAVTLTMSLRGGPKPTSEAIANAARNVPTDRLRLTNTFWSRPDGPSRVFDSVDAVATDQMTPPLVRQTEPSTPPPSFAADPAKQFEHFCREFVTRLKELPAIKLGILDSEICNVDSALRRMELQIKTIEGAYAAMGAEDRKRKVELPSLDRKRVLATPTEHLQNIRATYQKYRQFRHERYGDDPATFVNKSCEVRWSPTYEMDARKTDSILTPYVGTLTMVGTWYYDKTTKGETCRYRFTFAARDEKWVIRSIACMILEHDPAWAALEAIFDKSEGEWREVDISGGSGAYFRPMLN